MKALLAIALTLGASTPAVAQSIDAAAPEIDALFARYQAEQHVPGLVYGVVKDGRLAHVKGLGVQDLKAKRPVDAESLFRIASMTKAFTALAILSLRDAGKLALDDPAEKYVPEMRAWTYPTKDSPKIRVRDLLQHVGGFVTDDPWGDRQQVMRQEDFTALLAAGVPFSRAPGMSHEYSNFGYALLGRIVANVSGIPYRTYVERTILTPLGMVSSGFEVADAPAARRAIGYRWENDAWAQEPEMKDGAFNAMGGLQVSANDYAKWIAFLLAAWPPRDDAEAGPVRRSTVRELVQGLNFITIQKRPGATGATACSLPTAYGMGWRVAQDCDLGLALSHSGGYPGYGSHVVLFPEAGVALFALANRTYAGPSGPVWDSALALRKAGVMQRRPVPVSPVLEGFFADVRQTYAKGDLTPLQGKLAMNFLMDRSAENWRRTLAELKTQTGECAGAEPLEPTGAMTANFKLTCVKGRIEGQILLAPTTPQTIQALRFKMVPN